MIYQKSKNDKEMKIRVLDYLEKSFLRVVATEII